MPTIHMNYIGLLSNWSDFQQTSTEAPYLNLDGRFATAPTVTDIFYDLLLNEITGIKIPRPPYPYFLVPWPGSPKGMYYYINQNLNEVIALLQDNDGDKRIGRFDFNGQIKQLIFFDNPINDLLAFCVFRGIYYVVGTSQYNWGIFGYDPSHGLAQEAYIGNTYPDFAQSGTANFFARSIKNGMVFGYTLNGKLYQHFFGDPTYLRVAYNYAADTTDIYYSQLFLGEYNKIGAYGVLGPNLPILTESAFLGPSQNTNFAPINYGGAGFNLQFPIAFAGKSLKGIYFNNGTPYCLLYGGYLFSAVYFETFTHNQADNFARGVPLAGTLPH